MSKPLKDDEDTGSGEATSTSTMVTPVENAAIPSVETTDCCSFAEHGKLTWWSAVLLAAYVAGSVVAIVVIATYSIRRLPPPLSNTQGNDTAVGGVAFTLWQTSCPSVRPGEVFHCTTYVDCVLLGTSCAPPAVLEVMQCHTVAVAASVLNQVCVSGLS
ncbi:hypothetical protein DQ04_00681140 [Trypanosoma grayi]|uniref:hypothetical protein n=1 Tax=Trypanosoma grayi TaxID=71804 RepID=UPI0004F42165|nr:hypothetical protein DQ04_00681140 [Trypanosoma grayi]KEG13990.1 hypothetical protein DQ04_00681140 [Trypanosoma grayi]